MSVSISVDRFIFTIVPDLRILVTCISKALPFIDVYRRSLLARGVEYVRQCDATKL